VSSSSFKPCASELSTEKAQRTQDHRRASETRLNGSDKTGFGVDGDVDGGVGVGAGGFLRETSGCRAWSGADGVALLERGLGKVSGEQATGPRGGRPVVALYVESLFGSESGNSSAARSYSPVMLRGWCYYASSAAIVRDASSQLAVVIRRFLLLSPT
jgi:hypothetical protein